MALLITLLILLVLARLLPVIGHKYRENMWRYIKERLEFERETEEIKKKFKKQRGD